MADDQGLSQKIAQLEAHAADLAERAERCRKFMLAAQAAIVLGSGLLLALLFGLLRADPLTFIAGLTAAIGGVVAYGANASTEKQATAAIAETEAMRRELIGRIDLRLVAEDTAAGR